VIAVEIVFDMTCLAQPKDLKLESFFTDSHILDEMEHLGDEQKADVLLEFFFMTYLEYEPKGGERQPMSVRHQSYAYRIYRLAVIAAIRYILTRDFKSEKWYTNIVTAYISNSAIDDNLYGHIASFIANFVELAKAGKIDPTTFVKSFPQVVKNVLTDPDKVSGTEENVMVLYLNVCTQIGYLDMLLDETNTMLPIEGMEKLYKRFFKSLNDKRAAEADPSQLNATAATSS